MSETRSDTAPSGDVDDDAEPKGRLRTTAETLGGFIRRIPFSIALAVVLIVTAAVTGTMFGSASDATTSAWAAGVITTFDGASGGRSRPPWSSPSTRSSSSFGVIAAIVLLGVAERRMGTWRAIVAFLVTGVVGVALGTWRAVDRLPRRRVVGHRHSRRPDPRPAGGHRRRAHHGDGVHGVLWRRRIRVVTFAFILVFVLYDGDSSNVYRLIAAIAGYSSARCSQETPRHSRARRSSHAETRTLVAAVVAVTAIGPIVAFVNRSDLTPFAFGSYLFDDGRSTSTPSSPSAVTTAALADECVRQLALMSAQGSGMFLLSFVPVLLLLLAAWGLRNGRRFAWWLAIAVNVAILLFARTALDVTVTTADVEDGTGRSSTSASSSCGPSRCSRCRSASS